MPSIRDVRWWGPPLCLALGAALAGCGADQVQGRARDGAEADLPRKLVTAVECLGSHAAGLSAAADTAALATELADCAGTTVLDQDDEAVRTVDFLSRPGGTIAVASERHDGALALRMYTEGAGAAQAGVTSAIITLATCWQVTVDAAGDLGEPSGAECSEALITRANPTEVVPFDDLDVTFP